MSKAVEWLRSRSQKGKADKEKSAGKSSPSQSRRSNEKLSDEWAARADSSSRSNEPEGIYKGRMVSRSSEYEYEAGHGRHPGDWRYQTSRSDEFGSQPSRDLHHGPRSGDHVLRQNRFHAEQHEQHETHRAPLGKLPSADWAAQVSAPSPMSSGEYERRPMQRRWSSTEAGTISSDKRPAHGSWNTGEIEAEDPFDGRQSLRSHEAAQELKSAPKLNESDPDTFDLLLKNWPVLKSSSSDKRKFEARLLRLFELETSVVVTGDQQTRSRWSLGIMDEGIRALGTAIASRGYPKLQRLSFTHCRLLLESPFAKLARAFSRSNLPNLEEVNFHCNHYINNRGFIELARAFRTGGHFSKLTTLILTDNGMQDDGLKALAREAFGSGNLSNLRILHIGSYDIDERNEKIHEEFHLDAAREFARELSSSGHLPHIEDLKFSGCVDCEGVVSVLDALETRTTGAFTSLDLQHSPLGIDGIIVLARVVQLPQFSSLQSLGLSVGADEMPSLLEIFRSSNLCSLQRVALSKVSLGEEELVKLAALLENRHLPSLLEFSADCHENTLMSGRALVRAYERNNCLAAKLNFNVWPSEELHQELERRRMSNKELDELV
ncbi:hypothetical protein MPTK1_5g16610 [Marchantia polymorpha subsp. ruderalis]|nr:hypothetical protein MARPO_0117s0045 [Marchantia polymorpha]BBN11992.1 hypothetical protein Mp_5g16610 [Marchantia polymorpha subsp. ruderalis]|eukprot:PTQ30991.1 hypothetical protein MARPO_0117s0045 [Marchantia polymorpha]